jgi:phospholipid/cholesterol/gamma-HCH transport system permease protein
MAQNTPSAGMFNPFASLGRVVIGAIEQAGALALFSGNILGQMVKFPSLHGQFLRQCNFVGVESLPILLLTAFFTGGVLALQSFAGFDSAPLAGSQVPKVVVLSMLRELGPVLGSLMVAARVGSAMAAELGTMRVTEQVDALVASAINPMRYLVLPRVWACVLMMPLLVILANIVGIYGGQIVSVNVLSLSESQYVSVAFDTIKNEDIMMSVLKAAVFGFIIGLAATYHGFRANGGAAGVGSATTRAVVYAAVLILITDYFITAWFV